MTKRASKKKTRTREARGGRKAMFADGNMVVKTYRLPRSLITDLERIAGERGKSPTDLVREGLQAVVEQAKSAGGAP